MNALVEALSKGKTQTEDYGGDLHTRKSSHVSLPMEAAEFHFAAGELNVPVTPDETYVICFPVICSSSDNHDVRFKQVGRPYLDDKRVFESHESGGGNSPESDPPMVRLQSEPI